MSLLGRIVDINAGQHGPGHDHDEYGDKHGHERTEESVETAPGDILFEHALIDDRALLEEQHPRGDCGADVGHEKEEKLPVESTRKVWNQALVQYVPHRWMHEKGAWDVHQVERAEQ